MARTRTVYFWTDDELSRVDRLQRAAVLAASAEQPTTGTKLEGDPVAALRAEYEAERRAIEAAAKADGRYAVLRELGRNAWREVKRKHPPREDSKTDAVLGFNADTVDDDLVRASLVEPALSDDEFEDWVEEQGNSVWALLSATAWELTTGERTDPKPLPASLTRNTEQS